MNPRLLQHFDAISEAPEAVAKLRRLILDLAVRGKLVEQEAGDEPALELLARIRDEKARLMAAGGIRKEKAHVELDEATFPFVIPGSWQWSQLRAVGVLSPRVTSDDGTSAAFVPMRLISAKYGEPNTHQVRRWGDIKRSYTQFSEGDVGLAKITPCFENGKSTVFRDLPSGIGAGTTELHIVRPVLVSPDYILIFLKCPHFIGSGIPRMTGTAGQKRVPADYFANSPFPLPPLAEQHRIITKVDELMALCDQLQAARATREQQRDRLVAASLHRLAVNDMGDSDGTTGPATRGVEHARFLLEHLPRFTTRAEYMKQLRQAILDLAVRGRLVAQSPCDESATALLNRVRDRKKQLGINSAGPFRNDAHAVPLGWCQTTIGEYAVEIFTGPFGSALHQSDYVEGGVPLVNPSHMKNDHVVPDPRVSVSLEVARRLSSYALESGDIVMARRGEVGRAALVDTHQRGWLCGTGSFFLRFTEEVNRRYLLTLLRTSTVRKFLAGEAVGTTMVNLNHNILKRTPLAIPPTAEQHRIVAKIDELMALCDQLEAGLASAQTDRRRLLDSLLHEALQPTAVKDERIRNRSRSRAAVSCYVVSRLSTKRGFGRTAHMKYLYLAEAHLGLELGGAYAREAAGPLDAWIYDHEEQAASLGWFSPLASVLPSGKEKVTYGLGKCIGQIVEEAVSVLGPTQVELGRTLDLMGDMNTEEVEIIATLFAVWNDALLDGRSPDDDWIVKDFRENWHERKQRFLPAELKTRLGWMREKGLVPTGKPPRTVHQTSLEF